MMPFTDKRKSKTEAQILGSKAFAAISAVEGLRLGAASQERLNQLKSAGLSQEERRSEILRAYKALARLNRASHSKLDRDESSS